MNMEKSLAAIFRYFGLAMAVVFIAAIILGIIGIHSSALIARMGICCAIAIPVIGVAYVMLALFKIGETKYAVCAIILLILLALTVVWRIAN